MYLEGYRRECREHCEEDITAFLLRCPAAVGGKTGF